MRVCHCCNDTGPLDKIFFTCSYMDINETKTTNKSSCIESESIIKSKGKEVLLYFIYTSIMPMVNDIENMVKLFQKENKTHGVSGCLLYCMENYRVMQYVEGSPTDIANLLTNIRKDMRHKEFSVIEMNSCASRIFEAWEMYFESDSSKFIKTIENIKVGNNIRIYMSTFTDMSMINNAVSSIMNDSTEDNSVSGVISS